MLYCFMIQHQDGDAEDDVQDKLTGNSVKCQLTHLSILFFLLLQIWM